MAIVVVSGGCSGEGTPVGNGDDNAGMPEPLAGNEMGGETSGDKSARAAAATTTAETQASCIAVAPFYWEVGDAGGTLASGSVGLGAPLASTPMAIASGSKWPFAAYAVEKAGGAPAALDVPLLNFTSGHAGVQSCAPLGTVDSCLTDVAEMQVSANVGKFNYDGAHLQKLASLMGLGAADNAALAAEVKSQIGGEIDMAYDEPQPAAGIRTSADQYAIFLRKLLVGSSAPLLLGALLGEDAVCTNPVTCPAALFSPITGSTSTTESWHYSLAHWVEDDPAVGDGAFSSPGAYGFYPWVDATRTLYGVLAREAAFTGHNGYDSAVCGRAIRKAWVTGTVP